VTRFSVLAEPLRLDEVVAAVTRPEAGGIAVFLGTVRNHNAGQTVTRLEYDAYVPMAIKQMQRLAEEIEKELPGVVLAAQHRIGTLAIGDVAVVCAASAPHRGEAFRACQALIDRIKQHVPIWKREHGQTGSEWLNWVDARVAPPDVTDPTKTER
jgi:molybdopterin synthase catalytic subunit